MRNIFLCKTFKRAVTIVAISFVATLVLALCRFMPQAKSQSHTQSQSATRHHIDMWDPAWIDRDMWGPAIMDPEQRMRIERHWIFMQSGVPTQYRGQKKHSLLQPISLRTRSSACFLRAISNEST